MDGLRPTNGASTSSNAFPNQYSMGQHPNPQSANRHAMQETPPDQYQRMQHQHNPWNQPIPPTQQQMHPTNQPQYNQPQWMSQPLAGFNMPFLPPQVLQDAIALSMPVESADEGTLIQHILLGLRKGETYKDILNSLHGKNGHSASLWKDYYLDHKPRLDSWVNMCLQKDAAEPKPPHRPGSEPRYKAIKPPTIKKPSPASFKVESSPGPTFLTPSFAPVKKRQSTDSTGPRTTPQVLAQAAGSRRATINSLTSGNPVFDKRLPPPHASIVIPDPPSRSPSPPTIVIPKGRGNRYTPEDQDFFIKFIQWRLNDNPELTRQELCEMLSEKAPHHTAQSWASYWSNNHDLPDKILAMARGEECADDGSSNGREEDSEEERKRSSRKRPRYREPTTSEEEESSEEELPRVVSQRRRKVNDDDNEDDGESIRQWDERDMGLKGGPFTKADMYITARYICDFDNWDVASSKDRWNPFAEKHPQRSAKAWGEYYRRYEREIDLVVKKLHEQRDDHSSG